MKFFSLLFLLFWLAGCSGSKLTDPQKEIILYEVRYGTDPLHTMDVYLPADRNEKTPFVINIHGGAWTTGDKKDDEPLCKFLVSKGIAVANLNYRLTSPEGTHFPEMLDDVDSAFSFIQKKSEEWKVRNDGYSITGLSSGAHQALMYAYERNKNIKTIVERAGITDLVDERTLVYIRQNNLKSLMDLVMGMPENYAKYSPVLHVKNIPVLILHGAEDDVVPVEQAHSLADELKKQKIYHELIIIPEVGHDLEENSKSKDMVFQLMADWFLKFGK